MNSQNTTLQYRVPSSLQSEIDDLERRIAGYGAGTVSAAQLKAFRVPFGIYEQRVKGLYMARIRCAAGIISPLQFAAAARLATEYGSGALHVTTRQELQLHDVPIERLVPLLRELAARGLSTRGGGGNTVRNITASWDAGISAEEPFDVTSHAVELTSRLVALGDSWLLPRKFKIAFSNGVSDTAFATVNDVGFVASLQNGVRGFRVFVAGGLGRSPQPGMLLHDFIGEDEVFDVAESLKRLFSRNGNRRNKHAARLRFLWNRLGAEGFVDLYKKERASLAAEGNAPFTLPVDSAPVDGLFTPDRVTPPDHAAFSLWQQRYVVSQRRAGYSSVRIPLLLGNITSAQAEQLAAVALPLGDDSIRFTQDQNIVVRNIPDAYLGTIFVTARTIAPLSLESPFFGSAVACAGASTCQLGICRSRGALSAVINGLRDSKVNLDALGSFKMHLSGCTNSCGQHAIADLGFAGKAATSLSRRYPAYTVFTGAKLHGLRGSSLSEKAGEVPARNLPEFVSRLLDKYVARKSAYKNFGDFCATEGRALIAALCAEFHTVPSYETAPQYYRDFDDTNDFSLEGRGAGECAAGLFDLIDIDVARIRTLRDDLAVATESDIRLRLLKELALVSARSLLVARGVDVSDARVYNDFRENFIDAGLVEARFVPLIKAMDDNPDSAMSFEREIIELAQVIETLYATLDDTLQFHPESVPAKGAIPVDAEKDLRGVACPMNFVKTKMALAGLRAGQLLRISLDDGAPVDNVPGSVMAEGHEIVSREKTGSHWLVVIRKGQ